MTDDMHRSLAVGARRILAAKLALHKALPAGYVHDPAVAILLALFVDRLDGVATSRRAIRGVVDYVPTTIADRWLKVLAHDGMIEIDARGQEPFVGLTERGETRVRDTVLAVGKAEQQVRDDEAARLAGTAVGMADRADTLRRSS